MSPNVPLDPVKNGSDHILQNCFKLREPVRIVSPLVSTTSSANTLSRVAPYLTVRVPLAACAQLKVAVVDHQTSRMDGDLPICLTQQGLDTLAHGAAVYWHLCPAHAEASPHFPMQ